jgi:hypothetical protein
MLSVIIPISGRNPEREFNLRTVIPYPARQAEEHQLIIVEQYSDVPLWRDELGKHGDYIAIKGDILCKSWMRNVGARAAKGDVFMFLDGDVLYSDDYYTRVMERLGGLPYLIGWSVGHDLSHLATAKVMPGKGYSDDYPVSLSKTRHSVFTDTLGRSIIFQRDFFESIGGYHENYHGYGKEQKDIVYRAKAASGLLERLDYTLLHLWHEDRPRSNAEVWEARQETWADPERISALLVEADTGNKKGRSLIDIEGKPKPKRRTQRKKPEPVEEPEPEPELIPVVEEEPVAEVEVVVEVEEADVVEKEQPEQDE